MMRTSVTTLSRVAHGDEKFWQAVADVGWLVIGHDTLEVPGYESRFSNSAKNRLLHQRRMRRSRDKNETHHRHKNVSRSSLLLSSLKESISIVFNHYRTFHKNWKGRGISSKEGRLVKERMREGYTVESLCKAIDGCHKSPFHQGENDRGAKYLDLGLILRTSDHVNRFIEIAESTGDAVLSEKSQKNLRAAQSWLARHAEKDAADGANGAG